MATLPPAQRSWSRSALAAFDIYLTDEAERGRFRQQVQRWQPFDQTHMVPDQRFNVLLPLPASQELTLYLHVGGATTVRCN